MTVSQKKIAEKLGVSIALVSRVLSGRAIEIGISPDTIDRVLETSREMGYVPSAAARALKGKATQTIGIVVYDFKDPFFSAMVEQLQMQSRQLNYSLVLTGFLQRIPDQKDLQLLHKHALDGLIIIGSARDSSWLNEFRHIPKVRIGHGDPEEGTLCITPDEIQSAQLIIEHLVATGRKSAAYLSTQLPAHHIRQTAVAEAANACQLPLELLVFPENNPFKAGQELAGTAPHVDALICATDLIAMGAIHALARSGRSIPEEIAVIGFDDIPTANQYLPSITTIRQPIEKMAQTAFHALMHPNTRDEMRQPVQLIVRQSS